MTAHPDVAEEQAYLDHAYRCLAAMRARTEHAAGIADNAAQEVDSAIATAHLRQRLRTLDDGVSALSFGRLDEEAGDTFYIGRRHVEDAHGDPVVVDWRASVSTPFYRATAADPMELRRRRRFMVNGRELADILDEVFDDPDSMHAAMASGIPDPLLAELERARTGEMRDIVATIQAEQDVVIRAPLETCLVVQGGPGTGKTAVGLHRAAFLLYEHRRLLDDQGILVIGPNPIFLRYIGQVLPSLGETAVRQTTLERLLGGRVRAFDAPATARLKGDLRMAAVLANACALQVRMPTSDLELPTAWGMVRLSPDDVRAAVDVITARGVPFNVGRNALRIQLQRLAYQQHLERRAEHPAAEDDFQADLRQKGTLQAAVAKVWPTLSATALVRRLLSSPTALAAAAGGVLGRDEQRLLLRKGTSRLDDEPWTLGDLVLVDEADGLIAGAPRTYGHLVVDEAQDLSAMELRVLARRCPSRSMTILGDLAQATAVGAQESWLAAVDAFGGVHVARFEELELGYRVPAPIIDLANRLLPVAAPHVRPSRSVRVVGDAPLIVAVPAADRDARVATEVAARSARWSSVGVIVPEALLDGVAAALGAAGVAFGEGLRVGLDEKITLLPPPAAKGLEFDAVVVVEPARFLDGDATHGARLLYVALTRAVQELVVVHAEQLPAALNPL